MAFNPNMANREVADLVLLDFTTKKPFLNFDFANVSTSEFSADRVYATGGQGAPNLVAFDSSRTSTLTVTTQIMPVKLFQLLSGADIETKCSSLKREEFTTTAETYELKNAPKSGTVQVYKASDDCGTEVSGVTVSEKTISGLTANTSYVAYYFVDKASGVQVVKFLADKFPKAFEIHGTMPFKTEDDEIVESELIYYKAQPQSSFSLAFQNTGDPTSVDIVFDCLADEDGNIYDMIFPTGETV